MVKKRAATVYCAGQFAAAVPPRSKVSLAVAAALYGAAAMHGGPALAAAAAGAANANAGGSDVLQEITVTARKRTENLQDVPQSIDVFTSRDLQNL